MEALPTEIITDILSQLPVKTLLRCKSVCKFWNSLIKDPKFIKIHLNQTLTSDSDRHLLVSKDSLSLSCSSELKIDHNSLSFSELDHPLKPQKQLDLIGSCNGVVCISDISENNIFLYNPLTNSHCKLPSNQISIPERNIVASGFGYDSKNDDYKVLRIVRWFGNSDGFGRIENSNTKAQVYSLKDNSWRCIQDIPYICYRRSYHGVLVNGALHYRVRLRTMKFIVSFDLQTESFSHIDYPNYGYNITTAVTLPELRGCLGLCALNKFYEFRSDLVIGKVDLWIMKEYGNKESWVKLVSMREPKIIGSRNSHHLTRPFVYMKDDRRILLEVNDGDYCWYDLESKDVIRIATHDLPKGGKRRGMQILIGSLVSLQDKDGL